MLVFDRILNKYVELSEIESPIVLGRYIFTSDTQDIILNDCKVKKQNFLVPCNYVNGILEQDFENTKLLFHENELLNEDISSLVKHTLFDVSEELEIVDNLSDIKDINILLRNFDERLEISDFEQFLHKKLFHIEEVCRDPSYHLKREITKLNVARAKRIPVKAINYLAAHTEDWSRRRIRSVEPRKILSEIIDYDLGIYENQITASFIDKLLIYFSHRVKEVEIIDSFIANIKRILESRKIIDPTKKLYWYKKLERDYAKLGKAVESIEQSRIKVEKIKTFITSIQMRLFALLKTDLYIANSNTKNIISQKLKRTNLFDNHQHYRYVKILWEKFHKKENLSCSQKSAENQEIIKSYIDYSWVVVVKSLLQIGFVNFEGNDYKYSFSNPNIADISITLTKNENSNIFLELNEYKIHFLPIPTNKDLSNNLPKNIPNKYYLLLESSETRKDILKISPSDINSEDRISKIIFELVLKVYTSNFYFKLNSQLISKFKILKEWLINNSSLILDAGKKGKIDLWLKRKLTKSEIKELNDILTEQKTQLSPRSDIRSTQISELNNIKQEIINLGKDHFEKYEVCTMCGTRTESNLTNNYQNGFKYKCNNRGCGVEYGYTEKGIFYKITEFDQIKLNLSKRFSDIDENILLNAIGFENIRNGNK